MVQHINNWITQIDLEGLVEIPEKTIKTQLESYDSANTGFGYILLYEQVSIDNISNQGLSEEQLEVVSYAIFKIRNEWYVITDENISDIAKGLINLIAKSVK